MLKKNRKKHDRKHARPDNFEVGKKVLILEERKEQMEN